MWGNELLGRGWRSPCAIFLHVCLFPGLLVLHKNKGGGWGTFAAAYNLCSSLLFVCSCLWLIDVIPPKLTETVYPCPETAAFVLPGTSSAVCSSVHFSVLAGFHPWPCPVCHHGRPCSASHLLLWLCCCRCSPSRWSTRCPTPPLVSFHHDVDFCCQHECLQLLLWVRKQWTPLLN